MFRRHLIKVGVYSEGHYFQFLLEESSSLVCAAFRFKKKKELRLFICDANLTFVEHINRRCLQTSSAEEENFKAHAQWYVALKFLLCSCDLGCNNTFIVI